MILWDMTPHQKTGGFSGRERAPSTKKARSEAQAGCLEQGLPILKCMRYDMIYRVYIYYTDIYIYIPINIYIYTD